MSKILIFHDTYLMRGGAERMNIEIAKGLDADIATAIWSPDCYDARSMGYEGEIFEVDPGWRRGMIGFLRMKWRFFKSHHLWGDVTQGQGGFDIASYDSVLFSNEAITGIWGVKPGTKTYYYAHSISRHLFDQRSEYLAKVPFLARPFFLIFSVFLRWLYKKELSKIGTIFVNSEANKRRISEWCGRDDAIVIYPSVDVEKFDIFDEKSISQILAIDGIGLQSKENIQGTETESRFLPSQEGQRGEQQKIGKGDSKIEYKNYYLSFSRLTHAKRIDTIIRAFAQMPEKNIIILYGENDSQRDEFLKMGEGYSNIIFHSLKENQNLPVLLSGALASICISASEDFGMVAIESMACGVPVIAVDEGGYRESMIAGQTGYLIDPDDLEEDLIQIIQNTNSETLRDMEQDCRSRALDFSLAVMNTKMKQYIQ